jgi:hypothetical protein
MAQRPDDALDGWSALRRVLIDSLRAACAAQP